MKGITRCGYLAQAPAGQCAPQLHNYDIRTKPRPRKPCQRRGHAREENHASEENHAREEDHARGENYAREEDYAREETMPEKRENPAIW